MALISCLGQIMNYKERGNDIRNSQILAFNKRTFPLLFQMWKELEKGSLKSQES